MSEPLGSRLAGGDRLSPAAKWVFAIVGLLGANFAAMMILISKANEGPSRVVASYSDRTLRYHGAAEADRHNPASGWTATVAIVDGIMTLTAEDSSGAPLVGARVEVVGSYRSHGQRIVSELTATVPGEYRGHVGGTGWVDVSIAIERGGSRFVRELAVLAQ